VTDGGGDLESGLRRSGAARTQGASTDVSALRCRADWAGRPQERRADGVAMGARRLRPVASFHCERRLERSAAHGRTRDPADKLIGGWCFRSPDAGGRASAICPISCPRRLKTFSPRKVATRQLAQGNQRAFGGFLRRRARADRRWSATTHP
jgi:hypothetical protein